MRLINTNPLYFILFISISLLTACDRSGPVQHHYTTSIGCLITNDFYATYFSVYVEPANIENNTNEEIFKSFCKTIPRTGTAYFTADLVDEDLREMPISLRLVEQEIIGEDENYAKNFKDIRTLLTVPPKLYPQGTIEMQAELDKNGYYALYLLMGDEDALFEDDKLRSPVYVGADQSAKPIWSFIRDMAEFLMTFIFPMMMLTIILAPFLPVKKWIASSQNLLGGKRV